MKRVLVITYYWPPSGGSGVQRWVKFAKYLPQEGWQPVIYTPENPEYTVMDHTLEAEIPHAAEIIRRPILEPYNLYRRLMGRGASTDMKTLTAPRVHQTPGPAGGDVPVMPGSDRASSRLAGDEVTPISSGRKTWKQRLSLWIRGNLFVPDPRVGWVRPSVRFLKEYLAEHPVDVIVTTGPPHSMHLIGQRLHRELGIPWIPDFRDPWSRMYYLKHLPMTRRTWRRLRAMEQSVLDECSTVLAVTPLVQEEFQAQTKTPVAMITNGYDGGDFDQAVEPDGFFNVVHTGLLAADGNPVNFWKVLGIKAWADPDFKAALRLRLVGKVDRAVYEAIEEAGLKDHVVDLGYRDHLAAVREQLSASVLVLPLRNDPEYRPILPGKLFEYLASRRPVLGIGQEDGAMARVLADTGAGVTAGWDNIAAMRAFIDAAWDAFRAGQTPGQAGGDASVMPGSASVMPGLDRASVPGIAPGLPPVQGDITRFSRRSLTHELAALLEQVCGGGLAQRETETVEKQ